LNCLMDVVEIDGGICGPCVMMRPGILIKDWHGGGIVTEVLGLASEDGWINVGDVHGTVQRLEGKDFGWWETTVDAVEDVTVAGIKTCEELFPCCIVGLVLLRRKIRW